MQIDAVRTALTAGAGTGGAMALLLAFRRQRHAEQATLVTYDATLVAERDRGADLAQRTEDALERRVTDLYIAASEQLGSDKAPVRLAGLYALERLGQSTPSQRPTIMSLWCAYLRMRHEPLAEPLEIPEPGVGTGGQAREEHEVRLTAQRLLTAHLRPDLHGGIGLGPELYWPEVIEFDLSGAYLHDIQMAHCKLPARATFRGTTFVGRTAFDGATFAGVTDFDDASFTGDASFVGVSFASTVSFAGAKFSGEAHFPKAQFTDTASFVGSEFSQEAMFKEAEFGDGANFARARFTRRASFSMTTFVRSASFAAANFRGTAFFTGASLTDPTFTNSTFESVAWFDGTRLTERVRFDDVKFAEAVWFTAARFTQPWFDKTAFCGDANFTFTTFAQTARFDEATFYGIVDFGGATFANGARFEDAESTEEYRFDGARARSHSNIWPPGWSVSQLSDRDGYRQLVTDRSSTPPGEADANGDE